MDTLETCNKAALPTWWQNKSTQCTGVISYGMIHFANNKYSQFYIEASIKLRKNGRGRWCKSFLKPPREIIQQHKPEFIELLAFDRWTQEGLPLFYVEDGISNYERYLGLYDIPSRKVDPQQKEKERSDDLFAFRKRLRLEEGENTPVFKAEDIGELTNYLEARKPLIKAQFHATMAKFKVEYIAETIAQIQARNRANLVTPSESAVDIIAEHRRLQKTRRLQEAKQLEDIIRNFDNDEESSLDEDHFNNDDDFFKDKD